MILKELLDNAASECIDERESYLIIFTVGLNGYVCKNEGNTDESRALYHGKYRECQIWIERRGVSAALKYVLDHLNEVSELSGHSLSTEALLKLISSAAADA